MSRGLLDDHVVLLDRLADDGLQLLGLPRLGDVAIDAALVDGVDDGLDVGIGGEEKPGRLGADRLRPAEHFHARHAGHPLVGHDHVDVGGRFQDFERGRAVLAGDDPVVEPEEIVDGVQDGRFVIDDKKRGPRG